MNSEEKFALVILIGETLLVNGGEISRTRQTMKIIAQEYELEDFSTYILANGFFTSATLDGKTCTSKILETPLAPPNLGRVEAINTLSREIAQGLHTPEQVLVKIKEISKSKTNSRKILVFFAGLGSACFCYLYGGSALDSLLSLFSGMCLYLFMIYLSPKLNLSHVITTIVGGILVTLYTCIISSLGLPNSFDNVVIGSIFPMVPGIPFTNAIRHFLDNDYLSGLIRLVDALLTVVCIAAGVGIMLKIWSMLNFGVIL